MADTKRVLVVDDHSDVLDFLRSMLELTSEQYEVLGVPSAEEGLLELRQTEYDLLITDVRLPGMSGFDLVRRMRTLKPGIPSIMITAYSSEQGKQEAEDLGVYRYFQKPLDTDEMLTAVHTALYGELVVHADQPRKDAETGLDVPSSVSKRLESLRAETGATRLLLATMTGQIVLQVGRGHGLNLPKLSSLVARNLENSFLLSHELGGDDPTTIQYHAGDRVELYIANVGKEYFLAILFDAQARRGRMGTIWVFAQRAIKDLLMLLPSSGSAPQQASAGAGEMSPAVEAARATQPVPAPDLPPESTAVVIEAQPEELADLLAPTESDGFHTWEVGDEGELTEHDAFWEKAVAESSEAQIGRGLTFDEAREQGLIAAAAKEPVPAESPEEKNDLDAGDMGADLEEVPDNATELDTFWESALAEETDVPDSDEVFSLEEARRRGLLSTHDEPENAG